MKKLRHLVKNYGISYKITTSRTTSRKNLRDLVQNYGISYKKQTISHEITRSRRQHLAQPHSNLKQLCHSCTVTAVLAVIGSKFTWGQLYLCTTCTSTRYSLQLYSCTAYRYSCTAYSYTAVLTAAQLYKAVQTAHSCTVRGPTAAQSEDRPPVHHTFYNKKTVEFWVQSGKIRG